MRTTSSRFTDLIVWNKAYKFVIGVYQLTKAYPKSELYGLTSQFRRSAVSVAANIAEGFKKQSIKEKTRFLNIAEGSLEECKYYLILSKDLGYSQSDYLESLSDEISKLLYAYSSGIHSNHGSGT